VEACRVTDDDAKLLLYTPIVMAADVPAK
jgi:hypothetical protein